MNVVGKVGSLITQGVYSVATPFHPFGGAVDVVVVQQQDGTFRSTPWYVRFGKFQGVLKGAEKIVRIKVNDGEADFHMYLDNSGEAYFIREVVSGKEGETSGVLKDSDGLEGTRDDSSIDFSNNNEDRKEDNRHEGSVSNSGESLGANIIERTESDSDRRFYEFQDEQSSLEGSVELSEYGSNQYDSLDSVDHFAESHDLISEVVLVSVDGHILTAPISSSERNTENLQLITPQFHLGPGQETDFCEDNAEFSTGEEAWAADYIGDFDTSAQAAASDIRNTATDSNAVGHPLEICGGDEEHVCQTEETRNISNQEREPSIYIDSEDVSVGIRKEAAASDIRNTATDSNAVGHPLEICGGDEEHVCQTEETRNISNQEREPSIYRDSEDVSVGIRKEDIFKSCLELPELAMQVGNTDHQDSLLEIHEDAEELEEKSHHSIVANETRADGESKDRSGLSPSNSNSPVSIESLDLTPNCEPTKKTMLGTNQMDDSMSVQSVTNDQELEGETNSALADEGIQNSPQGHLPGDESSKSQTVEHQMSPSFGGVKSDSSIRFEISLCGNILRAGMGSSAAAEAFDTHRISEEEFKRSAASIIKNDNLVVRFREKYLPWNKASLIALGIAAYDLDLPIEPKDAIPVEQDETPKAGDDDSGVTSTPSGRRWRLWPIPFRRVKTLEHTGSHSSSEDVFVDSESDSQNQPIEPTSTSQGVSESPHKQLVRTNVPTTEQIASLNLKEGQNNVAFSFSTRVLGRQQVDAHIYLWKWNARIVISDVDGTITKSDVLGQFMPLVGKDWTQSGVARLFSAIKENGYQLLFLSARAIVQAYLTRSFLLNLKQDGKALPSGPVVISPDGLFPSLYREVIRRAPHEFKIACLEDIKALFPSDYNPFYAGFGNRDTDELSYRKIGIPKGKIFIINPKGEVAINHRIDVKSYTSLHTLVNDMFPPTSSMVEQEDYNSWNYWRVPLPDVDC